MLFLLKKFVGFWLMPMSFCVVAISAGLWLQRYPRHARVGRRLAVGGLIVMLILSNHFVARGLMRPLETRYEPIPELKAGAQLPPALAACRFIVVLGAGNGHSPGMAATSQLSGGALSRLTEAMRLLRVLPDAKLVVSGPGDGKRTPHAVVLARAAMSLGVEESRIVLIDQALDTEDEARLVRAQVGTAPVALVTSAWHMKRAMALFAGVGLKPLPCPTDFITHADDNFGFTQLLWTPGALGCTSWVFYERIGYLWIWLRGKTG